MTRKKNLLDAFGRDGLTPFQQDVLDFLISKEAEGRSWHHTDHLRRMLTGLDTWARLQGVTETTQFTRSHLDRFLVHLRDRNLKPSTLHGHFRAFRNFFHWYAEVGAPPSGWRNPIHKMRGPRVPRVTQSPASVEDLIAMIKSCKGHSFAADRDRALIMFMLETGVRANECGMIDIGDYDLRAGDCLIRHGKGQYQRNVYTVPFVSRAVQRYLAHRGALPDEAPLWATADGRRLSYWGLRQIFERRAQRLGLEAPALHGVRRAFATEKNKDGMSLIDLWRSLGHRDGQTVWRYVAEDQDHLRQLNRRTSPVAKYLGG